MDFENEQFKFGRLIEFANIIADIHNDAEIIADSNYNDNFSLTDFVKRINKRNEWLELELKDEHLEDLIGVFCGHARAFKYEDKIYCYSSFFEKNKSEYTDDDGIVFLEDNKLQLVEDPEKFHRECRRKIVFTNPIFN